MRTTSKGAVTTESGTDQLSPGTYILEIVLALPALQPPEVRAIIGSLGENMTGPLVGACCFGPHFTKSEIEENVDRYLKDAPVFGARVYYARYVEIGPSALSTSPEQLPQPPKLQNDDMAQLEKLLKDLTKKPPNQAPPTPPSTADSKVNNQTPTASDRATMTELDAIRSHIEGCWRIDPGEEGIENLSAQIRVFINPDGTVQRADITDTTRFFADAKFRTFANNARIAVLGCTGIPISPQHYNELKVMDLNFSPQGKIN